MATLRLVAHVSATAARETPNRYASGGPFGLWGLPLSCASTGSAAAVASMGDGVVWLWAVPSCFGDCGARFESLPVGATTMASPRLVNVAGLRAASLSRCLRTRFSKAQQAAHHHKLGL